MLQTNDIRLIHKMRQHRTAQNIPDTSGPMLTTIGNKSGKQQYLSTHSIYALGGILLASGCAIGIGVWMKEGALSLLFLSTAISITTQLGVIALMVGQSRIHATHQKHLDYTSAVNIKNELEMEWLHDKVDVLDLQLRNVQPGKQNVNLCKS